MPKIDIATCAGPQGLIEGEVVLTEHEGETALRAGDCAAFPKAAATVTT